MITNYLLSSALSTSHHAVISQIESATSVAEVDAVCRRELDRIRQRLVKGKGRVKDFDITEALVLLLFLENHRTTSVVPAEVDFALVHALNLAEGGGTLKSRSLGYLYLGLNLRPENDLSLLHFNSIVKDLSSSSVGATVHALRAVVHAPSADLAPAVQRRVLHLVSHKSAAIRRLALAALGALSGPAPDALEGLCERKIWKRLQDNNPSVALQAVKVLRKMTEHGFVDKATTTRALLKALDELNIAGTTIRSQSDASLLVYEVIKTTVDFGAVEKLQDVDAGAAVRSALQAADGKTVKEQALVLLLARNQQALQPAFWSVVQPLVVRIIRAASLSDDLNDTYFALRSLEALSIEEGGQILGERPVMERITSELQSEDAAIRKMALRILGRLSAELPTVHLDRLIEALAEAKDGVDGLAVRAVEVFTLTAAAISSPRRGETFASSVHRITTAFKTSAVLEHFIQSVLEWLGDAASNDQDSFTQTLLDIALVPVTGSSPTLALLACAVFCLFGAKALLPIGDACRVLVSFLRNHNSATLQQASLVSLAGLCATLGDGQTPKEALEAITALRAQATRHLRGKCDAFLRVAALPDGWVGLKPLLTDLSLPAVLQSLTAYARTLPELETPKSDGPSRSSNVAAVGGVTRGAASTLGLRYEAYPTAPTSSSRADKQSSTASSRRQQSPRKASSSGDAFRAADRTAQSFAGMTMSETVEEPYEDKVSADDLWSPFESSPVDRPSMR